MLDFDVLLEAAFVKLGSDSPTELARAIGLSGDYRSRRVARWRKAGGADYEGTVLLLEYAGVRATRARRMRDRMAAMFGEACATAR